MKTIKIKNTVLITSKINYITVPSPKHKNVFFVNMRNSYKKFVFSDSDKANSELERLLDSIDVATHKLQDTIILIDNIQYIDFPRDRFDKNVYVYMNNAFQNFKFDDNESAYEGASSLCKRLTSSKQVKKPVPEYKVPLNNDYKNQCYNGKPAFIE